MNCEKTQSPEHPAFDKMAPANYQYKLILRWWRHHIKFKKIFVVDTGFKIYLIGYNSAKKTLSLYPRMGWASCEHLHRNILVARNRLSNL